MQWPQVPILIRSADARRSLKTSGIRVGHKVLARAWSTAMKLSSLTVARVAMRRGGVAAAVVSAIVWLPTSPIGCAHGLELDLEPLPGQAGGGPAGPPPPGGAGAGGTAG